MLFAYAHIQKCCLELEHLIICGSSYCIVFFFHRDMHMYNNFMK